MGGLARFWTWEAKKTRLKRGRGTGSTWSCPSSFCGNIMHKSVAIGRQRNAMIVVEARSSVDWEGTLGMWLVGWSFGNVLYRHFSANEFLCTA